MYGSENEENKLDDGVLMMTLWCKVAGFVPQHDANDAVFGNKKDGKTGLRVRNMKISNSVILVVAESWDVLEANRFQTFPPESRWITLSLLLVTPPAVAVVTWPGTCVFACLSLVDECQNVRCQNLKKRSGGKYDLQSDLVCVFLYDRIRLHPRWCRPCNDYNNNNNFSLKNEPSHGFVFVFFKAKTSQEMIIPQIRAAWIKPVTINWIWISLVVC